ncbi:ABC transporter ATP-binding protein [Paenibacillus rhizovicinus]|uniref:ABC transporter ATP-binding protein n=2 Tax=Paenibacillus rhizovicinus TaxID=2704463 RepID=A0A6C0P933_9BACL|nr:ABC transporter ATP-binding protein [Paenibacillus rhizovicinus]
MNNHIAHIAVYFRKLHKFAGLKLYVNIVCMMGVSMLEGAGLFLFIPMLGLIGVFDTASADNIPFLSALMSPLGELPIGWRLPAVLGVFMLSVWTQAFLQLRLVNRNEAIEAGFIRHLQVELYQSLLQSSWSFFLTKRRSDFVHVMMQELSRASNGVYLSISLLSTCLFTLVQIGLAAWLSWPLTASILVCGVIMALILRPYHQRSKRNGERLSALMREFYAGMTEHFNGIKEIKSNRMEERHMGWFRDTSGELEQNAIMYTKLQSSSRFCYKAATGLLMALFVLCSVKLLHIPPEKLIVISLIFTRLWPKFSSLQSKWQRLAQTIPAFNSLQCLRMEYEAAKELDINEDVMDDNRVRMAHGIECRNVSYRYDRSRADFALEHIDLWIPANSMTAVVGKSGAGKSTLIDLLIGLMQPETGEVFADGELLVGERAVSFRRNVSYVAQEPFLFHASIRDNMFIAAPEVTEAMIWEALSFAAAEDFVRKLPQGLDTVLGDRGVRLSGGERQRIVLARAILRKPSILILDEATSALDGENEAKIQEALIRLKGSMTIIVIAHRLSTIRDANQVIVLEDGRLARSGGFQQLAKESDGVFGKLLSYQMTSSV